MVWAVTELAVAAPRAGQLIFGGLGPRPREELARIVYGTDHYRGL
jgi:hypothetical protein